MAISIDYSNPAELVINVPKADLTLIQASPIEIRQLDVDAFRLELKDLEDDSTGMAFTKTHNHNTTVEVGGVILARVVEILEPYVVQFEDGQYAVNLTGANNNIGDRLLVNQVSVRSSNSAGLQDLSTLLAAAYQGEVIVNTITGQAGTSTPIGTRGAPSGVISNALTIAEVNGIGVFRIMNSVVLTTVDFSAGYTFTSDNPVKVSLLINAGANVSNCQFKNMTVAGTLDGMNSINHSAMGEVFEVSGLIEECSFSGDLHLNGNVLIFNCTSNIPGGGYATLFSAGAGVVVQVRDFHGSLGVDGIVDGSHTFGGAGGRCVIESGCTGGTIHVRGDWFELVDNSGGGCTVLDERAAMSQEEAAKINEMHTRLDLEATKPNTYANDLSTITSSDWTLTQTDNGNGTSTVQRS